MLRTSEIVVVSGLPRSGTSLMMQMLHRGGLPLLTDEQRTADADNPRGYFEFEPVKKTREDPGWLPLARGKVVKMVSSLLYDLPATEAYRIIFMRRDLDEVLDSQEKMLSRLGRITAPRDTLKTSYTVHLDRILCWLQARRNLRLLEVNYNHLFDTPEHETQRIAEFLEGSVTPAPMLAAIDTSLYRNRSRGAAPALTRSYVTQGDQLERELRNLD